MDRKNRDFLLEDKFIEWRLLQTEELDSYWEAFRNNNPELSNDIDVAIKEFEVVRLNNKRLHLTDKQDIINNIFRKGKIRKRLKIFIQASSSVAAIAIIGLFIALLTNSNNDLTQTNTIVGLTLPEEEVYIISNENKTKIVNNSSLELTTDNKAIVTNDTGDKEEVSLATASMNRIVVPYGKRSNITLADGSKVWLNSGTQLDFPTTFTGSTREINVNGEIYIEVEENKDIPFIVNTNNMSIKVYGTSFNVTAYEEDDINRVVLVNGSVGLSVLGQKNEVILKPSEKADLIATDIIKETVNTSEYISWINDVLEFNETPISEILKRVGRYYNVQFENMPEISLNKQTCSGKLFLSNNLDSVMTAISSISSTEYTRNNNIIQINKNEEPMN